MTPRFFLACSVLVLLTQAVSGGVYQRTTDGKALIWNNFPEQDDVVSWSGARDSNGYATGPGTVTWYKLEKGFVTGSILPSKRRPVPIARYAGTMVGGKLNGLVTGVDAEGKTFRTRFVDGHRPETAAAQPSPTREQPQQEHRPKITAAPAEGPAPGRAVEKSKPSKKIASDEKPAREQPTEKPVANIKPSPAPEAPSVEVASIRSTPPPAPPSAVEEEIDSAVKERIIADFKDETQSVFSDVGGATDNFRGADRLDAVAPLPGPVSERVSSLIRRARDFRSTIGYETALREFRAETATVDGLAALDRVTRSIADKNASEANAKLSEFLSTNPEPPADSEKPLWGYLSSLRRLCSQFEKDADEHLKRADSFAAVNRTSDAIREYQEAYRIFPNPAIAEKIRQLESNSLGL